MSSLHESFVGASHNRLAAVQQQHRPAGVAEDVGREAIVGGAEE